MAVYLNEREVGTDPTTVGFPSIDSCMAIVYVANGVLFGHHNLGGSANAAWVDRATAFNTYFQNHFNRGAGTRLYGVTYVDRRGYSAPAATSWLGELTAYATALGYAGKIRGYNLSGSGVPPGAYVEFRKVGDKCQMWIKAWADADRTTGPNTDRYNHKYAATRPGGTVIEDTPLTIATNVATAGMQHVHSTRLRG